jgi:excisionase family DNA binding protein
MSKEDSKALINVPRAVAAPRHADLMQGLEEAFIAFLQSKSGPGAPMVPIDRRVFLTIAEAAEFTGLPASFLRRLIADSTLKAFRTGRAWRIPRAELEALPQKLELRAHRVEELPESEDREFQFNKLRRLGLAPPRAE